MSQANKSLIAVLMGGWSQEREISLKSGNAVLKALKNLGQPCVGIDVSPNISEELKNYDIQAAFIALHGRYGEDGTIQSLLEIAKIPYTGSSVLSSALAMDKFLSKELVRAQGLSTPDAWLFNAKTQSLDVFLEDFKKNILKEKNLDPFPLMVKASREGSSHGIFKINHMDEMKMALQKSAELDSRVLLERWISGREFTVSLLSGEAFPVVEIMTKRDFYDYEAKYVAGNTEFQCPADLELNLAQKLQQEAQKIYRYLDCEGLARVDFMLDASGKSYFLEINTIPGMTELSLAPRAAQAAGLNFEELVVKIVKTARLKLS